MLLLLQNISTSTRWILITWMRSYAVNVFYIHFGQLEPIGLFCIIILHCSKMYRTLEYSYVED